jgi:F0F1-type ATP synthase delta subunit
MKYAPKFYAKALAEVAAGQLSPAKEKEIIENFTKAVMDRGGRKQWPKIIAAAEQAMREKEGLRKVTVESARPLKNAESDLKGFIRKEDILEEKVDPEIIAGIKITLDDARQFDGSLSRKLNRLFSAKNSF